MTYDCDITDVPLSENVTADVRVYFVCSSPGCPRSYDHPGEGPELEPVDTEVLAIRCENGGEPWEKDADELEDAGWYMEAWRAAQQAVEDYDELYEHMLDSYLYRKDKYHYYWK